MDSPRQKLLAKIKALLSKTVANGCTENEAMAALTKARELMDEYEVTDTDLTFGGEEARIHREQKPDVDEIRARLVLAVGAFCGCKAFTAGIDRLAYAGLYSDTVFAHWLLDTLDEFVKRELRTFLEANPSPYRARRLEIRGFVYGCADRIAERLYGLARRTASTELTIKKNALITAAMAASGIQLRDRFRIRTINVKAEREGISAGNRATFDKPINEADKPKAIT